jgi:hypothetical protein
LAKREQNNEKIIAISTTRVVDEAQSQDTADAKALQDKYSMDGNLVNSSVTAESQSSDENSMDLLIMDFNVGDIILSDFLINSEFTKLNNDSEMFNMNNIISVTEGDALDLAPPPVVSYTTSGLSPEEMLQTWSPTDYNLQAGFGVDSDFRSLASFLE